MTMAESKLRRSAASPEAAAAAAAEASDLLRAIRSAQQATEQLTAFDQQVSRAAEQLTAATRAAHQLIERLGPPAPAPAVAPTAARFDELNRKLDELNGKVDRVLALLEQRTRP
jgi:hypothetical protein